MQRHIVLEGGFNIRDLGGIPTSDGQSTPWKRLIRSGNLDKISPAAQRAFLDYGVKTIIDLRDEWEKERYPNVFASIPTVTYLPLPLIGNKLSQDDDWKARTEVYESLKDVYLIYLAECQPQIGTIMRAIADTDGCIVFHCYAGKDRTGIISALLLSLVGVSHEVIADDYAQSHTQLEALMEEWRQYAAEHKMDSVQFEEEISAKAETMLSVLAAFEDEYGDVTNYLARCGVTPEQIERLRAQLVG